MTEEQWKAYCARLDNKNAQMRAMSAKDLTEAKPGDLLLSGRYLVKRRIRTKKAAAALAVERQGRIVVDDGGRYFAVLALCKDAL